MTDALDNTGGQEQQTTTGAEQSQQSTLLGGQAEQTTTTAATLLGGGTEQTTTAPADDSKPAPFQIPEKFQVKAGEELDFNASAQKLAEAYTNLEKRFGAGEARPADVAGYKFDPSFGEGFGEAFLANESAKAFMSKAHELGLNNAQLNFVMAELVSAQPSAAEQATGFTEAQATEALQKEWGEPLLFDRNLKSADKAARVLLGEEYQPFIQRYGNDPSIIKMLAKVGGEMSEDSLRLAGMPNIGSDSVDDLMSSEAYRNERHPDHRRVSAQVRAFFNRAVGQDEVI